MGRQVRLGWTYRCSIAIALCLLACAPSAQASIPSIPDGAGGQIQCTVQTGANAGERWCSGIFRTFDGTPIDINVGFPPAPTSGPDGDFPIVGSFHGWGGGKLGHGNGGWIDDGYAFFSMSDRGWGNSCGANDPKLQDPECANGYNHLMDTRYEVRDAQEVFEALADHQATGATSNEGLIDPLRIAANGGSYGGGTSFALALLKNRKMLPDGTLVPWVSARGKDLRIAAATPANAWTDLVYSLLPNGRTLDYVTDAPYLQSRIGVFKELLGTGLYVTGLQQSNYAPPGTDLDADLTGWVARFNAGEPYDGDPYATDAVDELITHHSSYYIDPETAPAPLYIASGFNDDLFPPDEAIRLYNRTRALHPGAPISLFFRNAGHGRGRERAADQALLAAARKAWLRYYVKGGGSPPYQGIETHTHTCPNNAPSDGPFLADTWAEMAPGEVTLRDPTVKVIAPEGGDAQISRAFTSDPCARTDAADQPEAASYRLDPAPPGGYTLMGSPTVIADIRSPVSNSQVAARLLDVAPDGMQTLVARALYRPDVAPMPTRQVFQLHPNGYKFEQGHVIKLELIANDTPYGRTSNGQGPVTVSSFELRLPMRERPDGDTIQPPAAKVVPAGYRLAPDYEYPHPASATPMRVPLVLAYEQCTASNSTHAAPLALPACDPARQSSLQLTTSALGRQSAYAKFRSIMGHPDTEANEADIAIAAALTDVRQAGNGSDYTGSVVLRTVLRITDSVNGPTGTSDATVRDAEFSIPIACASTSSASAGSHCEVDTTANALVPGFAAEGKRTIMSMLSVSVLDAGPDGEVEVGEEGGCPPVCGTGDEGIYLRQGLFSP